MGGIYFLKQGAHFTDCYYDYANLVTAAGHSTIGTGAYTDGHQIPLNEWYEPGPDGKLRQSEFQLRSTDTSS